MINHPAGLIVFLFTLEIAILSLSGHSKFKKYFHFIPPVFWIYFLPMLASTFGLIDAKAEIYDVVIQWVLPASLVLLLLATDVKAIVHLGRPAIVMMLAGSLGIMVGVPVSFWLFKPWVGPEMWSGFGALSGSWIGGSANMIAVKQAVATPDEIFAPMVIVDTVVPYVWMGILIAASGAQAIFDRSWKADRKILDDLSERAQIAVCPCKDPLVKGHLYLGIVLAAAGGALVSKSLGDILPGIPNVLSSYAWTIIAASLLGIGLSFSSVRRLETAGASRIGYVLLYFVLTTIGAKASIAKLDSALILIAAGFLAVAVHAAVILVTAKLIRSPMFLAAAASQANIGGVASAPIVAAVYQPNLASVGLLLAIWGNITGTYLGIITAQVCRMIAG